MGFEPVGQFHCRSVARLNVGRHSEADLNVSRHSGMVRQHQTRNLEIPGSVLRTAPE